MSKKSKRLRRRIKRSRKQKAVNGTIKDVHHILYMRKAWKSGAIGELRLYWYCRIPIPRDTLHRQIHTELKFIPVPRHTNARHTLEQLEYLVHYGGISEKDSIEKRLKVLIALFDCCEQPTADALREQLAIVNRFYHKPP